MNRLAEAAGVLALGGATAGTAQAVTFEFEWTGDAGYSAQGTFSYDSATAPLIISESGAGPTHTLENLSIAFFDPGRNPLDAFNSVADGIAQSRFFQFNFDTTTETLFGALNLGGGTGVIGEQFLLGDLGGLLNLRQDVDQMGQSIRLDQQDPGVVAVSQVPEASPASGAMVAAAALVALIRRRRGEGLGGDRL